MPRSTISVRSSIASKIRSSTIAVCTMQSGSRAKSSSLSLVATRRGRGRARRGGRRPGRPSRRWRPSSRPARGRGGRRCRRWRAARRCPVDQATTRLVSLTSSCWSSLQVGQSEVEVGLLQAAVDLDHLAGEEAAGAAGEVERRGRDVLGLADPAERRLAGHLGHHRLVADDVVQRAGQHAADRDRVDPDRGSEVLRGQPGVVGERGLGGAVGEVAATGHAARRRWRCSRSSRRRSSACAAPPPGSARGRWRR